MLKKGDNHFKYYFEDTYCHMFDAHKVYLVNKIQQERNKLKFTLIFNKLHNMIKLHNDLQSFLYQLEDTYSMLNMSFYEKLAYETMIDICKSLQKKGY